ncbi:MAG: gamma carbonic anhydrase family protein [Candidatus Thorarchaeota archaeon]|jgi:carbonic anhydrase/acetyltransferase-like protein (isoleucine patch superfamily)
MPVLPYRGKIPEIHKDALVSPLATIVGDVTVSEGASVFPGAVIRGDVAEIIIGRYTNIQDNVVIHGGDIYEADVHKGNIPVEIGDYVTVAHAAVVHSSKVEDVSLIGIRAIIYKGSIVEEGSIVGMNATLLENTRVPRRSIVVGIPAKVIKTVDDITYSMIKKHALRYYELAKSHKGSLFT